MLLISVGVSSLLSSCEKQPGSGGTSTIYGKVWVKDYNSAFTNLQEAYYGPDIWVYLVYGTDRDYSDRIRTSPDGTWEFKYLRTGNYKVYTYSKDSTLMTSAPIAVSREVEITGRKQEIEVPDLVIFE